MTDAFIISVAVPVPLYQNYSYLLDDSLANGPDGRQALLGRRVKIEFGHRSLIGIIVDIPDTSDIDPSSLKHAQLFEKEDAVISEPILLLLKWAAVYYCHPLGECIGNAMTSVAKRPRPLPSLSTTKWFRTEKSFSGPSNARRQKEILELVESHPDGVWEEALKIIQATRKQLLALEEKGYLQHQSLSIFEQETPSAKAACRIQLNAAQTESLEDLQALRGFEVALLEGITGAGKTEVYIHLVEQRISAGEQALILIPEINLTPQTFKRFQSQLSSSVAIIHSGLSDNEKYLTREKARQNQAKVIIGTRSAIFTPFQNLGLIVVDEEHDNSYKQMDGFKYSARDLAVKRGQLENCPVVLGSATPSLETLNHAVNERYRWIRLMERAGSGQLPSIKLIDIRHHALTDGFSPPLLKAIQETLARGEQVLVFQNRRGFAPTMMCESCGHLVTCRHCDARMTIHSQPPHLHCHHCDDKRAFPQKCDNCGSTAFTAVGAGTERIEASLQHQFPNTALVRIDRDSIKNQHQLDQALARIDSGEAAIIVGTQMLSKGHDFKHVTLVAVLDADSLFFSADFRSIERGAQQLIQLSGRTGRGERPGQVLIQTRLPEHPLFEHVAAHNYHDCAIEELEERKPCLLPPHTKMISIRADAKQLEHALEGLEAIMLDLAETVPESPNSQMIGPIEAGMPRKKGVYRAYLSIINNSLKDRAKLLLRLPESLNSAKKRGVRYSIDVDPQEYI